MEKGTEQIWQTREVWRMLPERFGCGDGVAIVERKGEEIYSVVIEMEMEMT